MKELYIILKEENHPDRGIDGVFGPFSSREEAYMVATEMDDALSNFNGSHRLYWHNIRTLERYATKGSRHES